jgi:hypothetical protein
MPRALGAEQTSNVAGDGGASHLQHVNTKKSLQRKDGAATARKRAFSDMKLRHTRLVLVGGRSRNGPNLGRSNGTLEAELWTLN